MGQRTSVYLDDNLQAAEKASGVPIAELVRRGLGAGSGETAQPTTPGPVGPSLVALPDGEPSHGAICMTPGCWQRDTRKYGLRSLPLCPACAALQGRTHQREIPPERSTPHAPLRRLTAQDRADQAPRDGCEPYPSL